MRAEGAATAATASAEREGLLPRMPVRVMLVEGDDSTRQIISALLRKCSYKVATISDGLKAWESLKEKPNDIDLVLTEVDLPSLSGFNLLTLIMDNEACNSIPVIMMSSHDSMSMIFKCMLKGAADFLVKPIRKNELRNLWQHVWRRLASGHGTISEQQDVMQVKHKTNGNSGNDALLTKHDSLQQENKECSEHGSDAQSSCTRSGMEAESERQKTLELKLPKLTSYTIENSGKQIRLDDATVVPESKAKGATSLAIATSKESPHDDVIMGESCSPMNHTSSKVSDLLVVNGQTQVKNVSTEKYTSHSEILGTSEKVQDNDVQKTLNCAPSLELFLTRHEESAEKHQNGDCNMLNHSYSSAFSLYSNRTLLPITPRPLNIENKNKEYVNNSHSAPLCTSLTSATSLENAKKTDVVLSAMDGSAVRCTPLRVVPFPVPIQGIPFENLGSGYPTNMQPILYQQSAHALWSPIASVWQEQSVQTNLSYQSDPGSKPWEGGHVEGQNGSNLQYHAVERKAEPVQPMEESLHVSTGAGPSASSSMCSGGLNCDTGVNGRMPNVINGSAGNVQDDHFLNREGAKQVEVSRMSQREAALNKFRLKRKERCFQKKVRYQSRKILAEQRPRVKGQFVRKVLLNSQSVPGGYYPSDSTPG